MQHTISVRDKQIQARAENAPQANISPYRASRAAEQRAQFNFTQSG
jgi:hypothetical protein